MAPVLGAGLQEPFEPPLPVLKLPFLVAACPGMEGGNRSGREKSRQEDEPQAARVGVAWTRTIDVASVACAVHFGTPFGAARGSSPTGSKPTRSSMRTGGDGRRRAAEPHSFAGTRRSVNDSRRRGGASAASPRTNS